MMFGELIAVYLFLGGTSAGAYFVLVILETFFARNLNLGCSFKMKRSSRFLNLHNAESVHYFHRLVYGGSLVSLIGGLLCLLADLGQPQLFYRLFIYPTTSPISFGVAFLVLFGICLCIELFADFIACPEGLRKLLPIVRVVGCLAALCVMTYTGVLLKSMLAVQLWQSWWLPVLFVLSALSCGCAVVLISLYVTEEVRLFSEASLSLFRIDFVLVVLEFIIFAIYVFDIFAPANFGLLEGFITAPDLLIYFVAFMLGGILIPLAIDGIMLRGKRQDCRVCGYVSGASVLLGGLAFRFLVVIGASIFVA